MIGHVDDAEGQGVEGLGEEAEEDWGAEHVECWVKRV